MAYPASGGYVAYDYARVEHGLTLTLTGSSRHCELRVLLPDGALEPTSVSVDGHAAAFAVSEVEGSRYVALSVALPGPRTVVVGA